MEGLTPATIVDQAIALLNGSVLEASGSAFDPAVSYARVEVPNTKTDKKIPSKIIAQDVQSQSFDSSTRAIKEPFSFEQLGSLRIGAFQQGISGEIDISPDGITGINSDGTPTLNLDGVSGDGTFFGIVKAAGFDVIDTQGLISSNNFLIGHLEDNTVRTTASTSYTDITGGALSPFTLVRDCKVLLVVTASGRNINWLSDASSISISVFDSFDSASRLSFPLYIEYQLVSVNGGGAPYTNFDYNIDYQSNSFAVILDLSAGIHTFKLQFKVVGTGTAEVSFTQIGYIIYGN